MVGESLVNNSLPPITGTFKPRHCFLRDLGEILPQWGAQGVLLTREAAETSVVPHAGDAHRRGNTSRRQLDTDSRSAHPRDESRR